MPPAKSTMSARTIRMGGGRKRLWVPAIGALVGEGMGELSTKKCIWATVEKEKRFLGVGLSHKNKRKVYQWWTMSCTRNCWVLT